MNERTRRHFDTILEDVLADLPRWIHELIDEVPLHVEDYPSEEMLVRLGIRHRSRLCGLYTGIPLTDRSVQHSGVLPDVVTIFREGIMAAAANFHGRVTDASLRRQIRITILHELGHHHGLDEDDLRELGYG